MTTTHVHKFGGTSVANEDRLTSAARLIKERAKGVRTVVVSSATGGTTDRLLDLAACALKGDTEQASLICKEIEERHLNILEKLGGDDGEIEKEISSLLSDLPKLAEAVATSGELTLRMSDRIVIKGEKLAVRLFAKALKNEGVEAVFCDSDEFLNTDGNFGSGSVIEGEYEADVQKYLGRHLDEGRIAVVTGFCGRSPEGVTVTLGRGGSDLSATLFGAALGAGEVTIWTDVDGVFTADPRVVKDARVLDQLHYREAAELSFFGAKVLHPRTMIPVASKGIPIRICNSLNPSAKGTIVNGDQRPGSQPVKAVSALKDLALISLEGKGMAGIPGIVARLFKAIADGKISVTMISQASSEASICIAIQQSDVDKAKALLNEEFERDLERRVVERIVIREDVALVAVVGIGMAHVPGVAGRTTSSLGDSNVNILAIAQGSSELNITLAVSGANQAGAVESLHSSFGLSG